MAVFNGSTYQRRAMALRDVASSKLAVLTGWFRCADGEGGVIFVGGAGVTPYIKLSLSTSTGLVTFAVASSTPTTLWSVTTTTAYDDDDIHHFALSLSLGASRGQFYIDAASATVTTNTALADGTIAFASATDWIVGADLAGATPFTGQLYDVAFWPGVTLDLSDQEDLQKLVAKDSLRLKTDPPALKPVGYGNEGRDLLDPAMIIFSSGFQKNVGVGGQFSLTGQIGEDSAEEDAPSGYRFFPRWRTPGERWFPSEQSGDPFPRGETFIETREGLSSHGKRLGVEEMDAPTRRERPGFSFSELVLGIEEEDDQEDYFR